VRVMSDLLRKAWFMKHRPSLRIVCGVTGAAILLSLAAGCSGGKKPDTSAPPTSAGAAASSSSSSDALPPGLKDEFVQHEAVALKAIKKGGDSIRRLPDPATGAQLKQILDPMAKATGTFDEQLRAMAWPASAKSAVDGVIAADSKWTADANQVSTRATVSRADLAKALGSDFTAQQAAMDRVRGRLGLPPL
jgi:hypothetical protein